MVWCLIYLSQRIHFTRFEQSTNFLLAFASTVISRLGPRPNRWPYFSFQDIYVFWNGPSSTRRAVVLTVIILSRAVICCWPSSAQLFLVSGPVGTHDCIFVSFPRYLRVLKRDFLFDERWGKSSWRLLREQHQVAAGLRQLRTLLTEQSLLPQAKNKLRTFYSQTLHSPAGRSIRRTIGKSVGRYANW
jgi:hypothetical protein